jgi:hypothetical protein
MRQTVGQQDLGAVGELGRIARQRITHLQGPGQIRCAVLEYIVSFRQACVTAGERC